MLSCPEWLTVGLQRDFQSHKLESSTSLSLTVSVPVQGPLIRFFLLPNPHTQEGYILMVSEFHIFKMLLSESSLEGSLGLLDGMSLNRNECKFMMAFPFVRR